MFQTGWYNSRSKIQDIKIRDIKIREIKIREIKIRDIKIRDIKIWDIPLTFATPSVSFAPFNFAPPPKFQSVDLICLAYWNCRSDGYDTVYCFLSFSFMSLASISLVGVLSIFC